MLPTHVAYKVGIVEFPAFVAFWHYDISSASSPCSLTVVTVSGAHEAISHFILSYKPLGEGMHNSWWLNCGLFVLSKSLESSVKVAISST